MTLNAVVTAFGHFVTVDHVSLDVQGGWFVALARALVHRLLAFLTDEPLSNLDARLRVQRRAELKRYHQELKATVISVTHDQMESPRRGAHPHAPV